MSDVRSVGDLSRPGTNAGPSQETQSATTTDGLAQITPKSEHVCQRCLRELANITAHEHKVYRCKVCKALFCPACETPEFPELFAPDKCSRLPAQDLVCPVCTHNGAR